MKMKQLKLHLTKTKEVPTVQATKIWVRVCHQRLVKLAEGEGQDPVTMRSWSSCQNTLQIFHSLDLRVRVANVSKKPNIFTWAMSSVISRNFRRSFIVLIFKHFLWNQKFECIRNSVWGSQGPGVRRKVRAAANPVGTAAAQTTMKKTVHTSGIEVNIPLFGVWKKTQTDSRSRYSGFSSVTKSLISRDTVILHDKTTLKWQCHMKWHFSWR